LRIDYVASLQNAAQVIAGLHPGKKRLVFVDSRANVEAVGADLHRMGVERSSRTLRLLGKSGSGLNWPSKTSATV